MDNMYNTTRIQNTKLVGAGKNTSKSSPENKAASLFDTQNVTSDTTSKVKYGGNRCALVQQAKAKILQFFKGRWSGCFLGPTYGILLYLYITYMILRGPPFTKSSLSQQSKTNRTEYKCNELEYCEQNNNPLMDAQTDTIKQLLDTVDFNRNQTSGHNDTKAYFQPLITEEAR